MTVAKLRGVVESIEPGKIKGQEIVTVRLGKKGRLIHDVVSGMLGLSKGDRVTLVISEEMPSGKEEYDFCGHGYLVAPEEEKGKTILSIWGIIFIFDPPLGLEEERKYYLCIKKGKTKK